jgi:hypothetical protein
LAASLSASAFDFSDPATVSATAIPASSEGGGGGGSILFEWHMEDADVTAGTPAGQSAGDTTASITGATFVTDPKQDGTYSLYPANPNYGAEFDAAALYSASEGTIQFYCIINPHLADPTPVRIRFNTDNNNRINLDFANTDAIRARYVGGGTTVSATSSNGSIVDGQWHKITVRWRATGDPNLSITVDDGSEGTSNTDLPTFSSAPNLLFIGNGSTTDGEMHVDNITIWDTWQ